MRKKKTAINFPKPGMTNILDRTNGQSAERGSGIYDSGMVRTVNVTNNGVSATVGRNGYHTQITWNAQKQDWNFKCSCPYDWGGICKHLVALGYWIDENCEQVLEEVTKDRREEILQLIKEADENTKNEILLELLLSNETLVEKLKTEAAALESSPGDKSIDELIDEYIEAFREIDLPDEEEAFERNNRNYDYYVEQWEMAEEIQQEELEFQVGDIFDHIERLIETGRFLEAVCNLIALPEALEKFEEEEEYDNFPDGETIELFSNYFEEKLEEMYKLFLGQIIKEETQEKILDTILTRYKKPAFEKIPFYLIENLLLNISFNRKTAEKLLEILQKEEYLTESPQLQIKLAESLDDEVLKLEIYERFAGTNMMAAKFLLEKYADNKQEYHRVAEKAIHPLRKPLNAEIFPHLDPAINLPLYRKTALLMFEETCDISYYRKYKGTLQDFEYKELLKNYREEKYFLHTFRILVEEKQFTEAFDLFRKQESYVLSDKECLPWLIPHLQVRCFNYITQKALRMLENAGSRGTYAQAGYLFSLLLAYPDKELKKQGIVIIEQLCKKHRNRRAMLEEFRAKGISC